MYKLVFNMGSFSINSHKLKYNLQDPIFQRFKSNRSKGTYRDGYCKGVSVFQHVNNLNKQRATKNRWFPNLQD